MSSPYDEWRPVWKGVQPAERLDWYRFSWLTDAEVETLWKHLSVCKECADFVLAARAFAADEPRLPVVREEEIRAGWKVLAQRLRRSASTRAYERPRPQVSRGSSSNLSCGEKWIPFTARDSWLRMSALGICSFMALLWVSGMEFRLTWDPAVLPFVENAAWTTEVALHTIEPWGTSRQSEDVVEVRCGDVLILFIEKRLAAQLLILEVVDPSGHVRHRVKNLERPSDGLLSLQLPPSVLVMGQYDLNLWDRDGAEPVSVYRIRIQP